MSSNSVSIDEEFSWFLGQPQDFPLGVITLDMDPRHVLAELLCVVVHTIRYMFVPSGLDLRRLLYFSCRAAAGFEAWVIGAMLCFFVTLMFVSGDLIVDTAIICVVRQAFRGRSIATIVLAETLNGLDMDFVDRGEFFWGAPILLYMWLLERHRFISANQIRMGVLHSPSLFF